MLTCPAPARAARAGEQSLSANLLTSGDDDGVKVSPTVSCNNHVLIVRRSMSTCTATTGGISRAIKLFRTNLLDFVLTMKNVNKDGEEWWVGNVGHGGAVKLTDLKEMFDYGSDNKREEDKGKGAC